MVVGRLLLILLLALLQEEQGGWQDSKDCSVM